MTLKLLALTSMAAGILTLPATADQWDKMTVFTFSAPVEVPGQVLPPGTYVFKLVDSPSNRQIVQIFTKDEKRVIGTFLTIPDYRLTPPDKALISFEERAAEAPEAIKAWFYPGDHYGSEFVYPKNRAVQLAKQSKQEVPSMPAEMAANTTTSGDQNSKPVTDMKQATVSALKPNGDEVAVAEVFMIAAPPTPPPPPPQPPRTLVALVSAEPAAPQAVSTNDAPAKRLPATASPHPAIALAGMLLLAAAFALRKRVGI